MSKKFWGVLLVLFLLVPMVADAQSQYKKEYKFCMILGPSFLWTRIGDFFADEVRDRTKGRINIKVYPGAQLLAGQQLNEFMMLENGVIDFAYDSTINWSPQIKELNLFSLPFFFPHGRYIYDSVDEIVDGEVGRKLFRIIESKGVVGLAWGEDGFRDLCNNRLLVKTVDDMKDLKIRIVGSPIFVDIYRALGANPMAINMAEAVTGLQQGTVDGAEWALNAIARDVKVWQWTKYCTTWHYVIDPIIFGVSKKTWATFTEEDKKIILTAARKWSKYQKEDARRGMIEYVAGIKGPGNRMFVDDVYKEYKDNGMAVGDLTLEAWKGFRDRTADVRKKWKENIGSELVTEAENAIKKHFITR
jgi:TRAP-type transport system periplasmic protein